jgi:hypothetical protein
LESEKEKRGNKTKRLVDEEKEKAYQVSTCIRYLIGYGADF